MRKLRPDDLNRIKCRFCTLQPRKLDDSSVDNGGESPDKPSDFKSQRSRLQIGFAALSPVKFAFNKCGFDMLALKLTLVPCFLLLISMSGKWWGPAIAGWLAGLPVVAGPILFLLVLIHGPEFGTHAAILSLSAILASEAFNFAYAWTCRSFRWQAALGVAVITWLIAATGLSFMPATPLWATGAAVVAVAFGQAFLPSTRTSAKGGMLTARDLGTRMAAGALLTLLVTTLSSAMGAGWSGLLAVFPLLGSVLSVSSHRSHGPEFVISMLRGMVLGRFSFAAFCLFLVNALPRAANANSIGLVFAGAAATALAVQWLTRRIALAQHLKQQKTLGAITPID